MEISFETIVNTIFYLGAIQGVILTIFLFNVKTNKLSNRLLGILTTLWAIILLVFALQSHGLYRHYPHLLRTFYHLLFAWFPLLYLSVKYLISSHKKFEKKDYLHFVPMLVNILLYVTFYFKSAEEKIELNNVESGYYYFATLITEEILSIQGIVYTILSLIIISRYKHNIVDYHSNIDSKVLNGYRNGIILALIAWVIGIVGVQVERVNFDIGVDLFLIVYLTFVAIIYLLSILAIRSPEVFKLSDKMARPFENKDLLADDLSKTAGLVAPVSATVKKTDLISKEDEVLNEKLLEYMVSQKPYLNSELSLQELSEHLEVTRHQLSAVINQLLHMNFYEFVNIYRINEVKGLMQDPQNTDQSNYELAYEAGFNSKASFYRIFKQFTDRTPSEFRGGVRQA